MSEIPRWDDIVEQVSREIPSLTKDTSKDIDVLVNFWIETIRDTEKSRHILDDTGFFDSFTRPKVFNEKARDAKFLLIQQLAEKLAFEKGTDDFVIRLENTLELVHEAGLILLKEFIAECAVHQSRVRQTINNALESRKKET